VNRVPGDQNPWMLAAQEPRVARSRRMADDAVECGRSWRRGWSRGGRRLGSLLPTGWSVPRSAALLPAV